MNAELVRRAWPAEVRRAGRKIVGLAAPFGALSVDLGGFRERIERGAFAESIGPGADVAALVDHDSGRLLGRTSSGTLRLHEEERGLVAELDPPDTTDGRDLLELIGRGDVRGMSFGFMVKRDAWDWDQEPPVRTLRAVELIEVSWVTWPAYQATEADRRAFSEVRNRHAGTSALRARLANLSTVR